jgi:hypothetical protein
MLTIFIFFTTEINPWFAKGDVGTVKYRAVIDVDLKYVGVKKC